MMPDLPNVGWERDVESFREFFENPAFRTDGRTRYPTLVIRGTGLYELWKAGLYRNSDPALLVELVRRPCRTPPLLAAHRCLLQLHPTPRQHAYLPQNALQLTCTCTGMQHPRFSRLRYPTQEIHSAVQGFARLGLPAHMRTQACPCMGLHTFREGLVLVSCMHLSMMMLRLSSPEGGRNRW